MFDAMQCESVKSSSSTPSTWASVAMASPLPSNAARRLRLPPASPPAPPASQSQRRKPWSWRGLHTLPLWSGGTGILGYLTTTCPLGSLGSPALPPPPPFHYHHHYTFTFTFTTALPGVAVSCLHRVPSKSTQHSEDATAHQRICVGTYYYCLSTSLPSTPPLRLSAESAA
ncbi:hypothetical protein K431DRAFT_30023 [Polychaeton citri CBS 116435]|uniref:Uncharacterized protein n=1 Tax=Polychaeton citri CBS 116435 TaxID=1314669 RepID=A0A9P4UKM6_9PEZI|nr:hypothetical protein K431DRAFT_30023 [Polychaeton citri CBS 116435]